MGICSCFSNFVIGVSATVYLLIGIIFIAASAATFFTPFGEILEPIYAGSVLGGGVAIFFIAVIGFCAACDKKTTCLLWVFTLLTFVIVVAFIALTVVMFSYEDVLKAAAGINADAGVEAAAGAITGSGEALVEELATNTFRACVGVTNATAVAGVYAFECRDGYFETLGSTINDNCYAPPINATQLGSCYNAFPEWTTTVAFSSGTASDVLAVLNTPKGIFCACSSVVINEYVLPYILWAKIAVICVAAFFLLVFLACIYQICAVRGCCGGKAKARAEANQNGSQQFDSVQMAGMPTDIKRGTGKKYSAGDTGFIARP